MGTTDTTAHFLEPLKKPENIRKIANPFGPAVADSNPNCRVHNLGLRLLMLNAFEGRLSVISRKMSGSCCFWGVGVCTLNLSQLQCLGIAEALFNSTLGETTIQSHALGPAPTHQLTVCHGAHIKAIYG